MPEPLYWSHATKDDVADLQVFTCCRDERKQPPFWSWRHTQPWAYKAQGLARGCQPCRDPEFLLLGRHRHTGELIVVVRWAETSSRDGAIIKVVAVSLAYQRQGYVRQAWNELLADIESRAVPHGVEVVHILTEVHPQNEPSLKTLATLGFQFHQVKQDHQVWALDLFLAAQDPIVFPAR